MSKPFAAMESALNCYGATFRDLPARATRSRSKMHSAAAADLETAREVVEAAQRVMLMFLNSKWPSDKSLGYAQAFSGLRVALGKAGLAHD